MEIYLVGGAVRDELLGKPIQERDWVIIGATPEEMIALNFQPVGKDFPVFLHPETHEEYALARTERKTGKGYKGFHFYATPDVSLEEDLKRRDLTINAMAKSASGELIDPFNGKADLEAQLLRHVSPAFAEDPVRILRVARFSCQLSQFHVHPETNRLMQEMVNAGEVNALVAERVWKEFFRALCTDQPIRFFHILHDCHALSVLFPELKIHDVGLKALTYATQLTNQPEARFAALLHHLSLMQIKQFCKHYRVPKEYAELALLTAQCNTEYHQLNTRNAAQLWQFLKMTDAFRRPERFQLLIAACRATREKSVDYTVLLNNALSAAKAVDLRALLQKNLQGQEFAIALQTLQIKAIQRINT